MRRGGRRADRACSLEGYELARAVRERQSEDKSRAKDVGNEVDD